MTTPASEFPRAADSDVAAVGPRSGDPRPAGGPDAIVPPPIGPGPGVYPPFAAPPREGVRRRTWIGVGIGALVLVLCCGGGLFGFGSVTVIARDQQVKDARTVVNKYMSDWQRQDFAGAYQLLCPDLKDSSTPSEFAAQLGENLIDSFAVRDVDETDQELVVSVDAAFVGGRTGTLHYNVITDSDGSSKICD